jgi:hypothetical protein
MLHPVIRPVILMMNKPAVAWTGPIAGTLRFHPFHDGPERLMILQD